MLNSPELLQFNSEVSPRLGRHECSVFTVLYEQLLNAPQQLLRDRLWPIIVLTTHTINYAATTYKVTNICHSISTHK